MSKTSLLATFIGIVILALCLILSGCSTTAIDILNLAVGALEVALPLIGPAAGIDPGTLAAVSGYLGGVSQAITEASSILAGTGTDAQKAAAIAAAFAGIAKPLVPPQYSALAAAVEQVAQYVAQFLTKAAAGSASPAIHILSSGDAVKVQAVQQRAVKIHRAVAK